MSGKRKTQGSDNLLTRRLPAWKKLTELRVKQKSQEQQNLPTLNDLFSSDSKRASKFSTRCGELFLDYSKSHLTDEIFSLLCEATQDANLKSAITSLFSGDHINNTEDRAALHTLLRTSNPLCAGQPIDGYQQDIFSCQKKMQHFTNEIHQQNWLGFNGKPITHIVNIGVGGSDLGPRVVCEALSHYKTSTLDVNFISNIDATEFYRVTAPLAPETTLFIIASKTFTTLETMKNANLAKQWILAGGCDKAQLNRHFVAASANIKKATEFGIAEDNIFPLWDWVGGRYSLWSAIGLPIALTIGWDNFKSLLSGAEEMDEHFSTAEPKNNMPVIMALLTLWYSQLWGATNQAVMPYSNQLRNLPLLLQQLDMESLGKGVNRNGETLNHPSGIALWGVEGSNGQHSFHQLFHQGTQFVPLDFIAELKPNHDNYAQHQQLLSCCLSQSQALMSGKDYATAQQELVDNGATESTAKQLAKHKVIAGNKPSNTLLMESLSPKNLGALIALYEHKVFTLSVLLDINPFDQWGVELGKQLGSKIDDALTHKKRPENWDSSTKQLAELISNALK